MSSGERSSTATHDALIGSRIGDRYVVHTVRGRGGMGVVYEGTHEQLHRPVAIKVLGPQWVGHEIAIARFFREARTAGSMGHPNIVEIYDLGTLPDGRPYLVMPLLDGMDLAGILETYGPLEPERVVELLAGVGRALDLMHTKGLVHRDIKPENLMLVRREDGEELVKILDFGLAALAESDKRLTRDGAIFGTPHYMAPEAASGAMPSSLGDVYSLAVVAFELIAGKLPFDSNNALRLLALKTERDAPSMAEVAHRPFPEALEKAMARALSRNTDHRPRTATAFIDSLRVAVRAKGKGVSPGPSRGTIPTSVAPPAAKLPGLIVEHESVPLLPARSAVDRAAMERFAELDPGTTDRLRQKLRSRRRRLVGALLAAVVSLGVVAWIVPKLVPPTRSERAHETKQPPQPSPAPSEPASLAVTPEPPHAEPSAADLAPDVPAPPANKPKRPRGAKPAGKPAATTPAEAAPEAPRPDADTVRAAELSKQGTTHLAKGQLPTAIERFREATQLAPQHASAWRGLGIAHANMNHRAEAVRAYRRYLELAPTAPDAAQIRARLAELETR